MRGTSRRSEGLSAIEAAGIEPALADPERPATLLDLLGDVAVVHWLLGSAQGTPAAVAAIHGERLERLLEKLVDTPVRGFVYERGGSVHPRLTVAGEGIVRVAAATWRIPVEVVETGADDRPAWLEAMARATSKAVSGGRESI